MEDKATSIRRAIAAQLNIEISEVVDEKTMKALGADELDEIEIAMALEGEMDIEIPDTAVLSGDGRTTVRQVIEFVTRPTNQSA